MTTERTMARPAGRSTGPADVRVAVVIPCFNDGRFVAAAIASLRGEEHHELVVVDDGSSDPDTLAALEELKAAGIVVLHQPNQGVSTARMTGVAATGAPYVLPLDADDEISPGALAAMADALDADDHLAAVWGDVHLTGTMDAIQRKAPALDPWFITYVNEHPLTALYRRTALEAVGGWQFGTDFEDWDLWMAFAERGLPAVKLPIVHYRYRQHEQVRARRAGEGKDDVIVPAIQGRHPALMAARPRTWWRSPEPLAIRLTLPVISVIPGLRRRRRAYLYDVVLRMFDPRRRLVVDGATVPGPIGSALTGLRSRLRPPAAAD